MQAIERALRDEPSFTIVYGASSTGKVCVIPVSPSPTVDFVACLQTALLREVLSQEKYHVLHFDLRIAGFADLASLYLSLNQQMEQYFEEIAKMEGYEEFKREAWSFKVRALQVCYSHMPDLPLSTTVFLLNAVWLKQRKESRAGVLRRAMLPG